MTKRRRSGLDWSGVSFSLVCRKDLAVGGKTGQDQVSGIGLSCPVSHEDACAQNSRLLGLITSGQPRFLWSRGFDIGVKYS